MSDTTPRQQINFRLDPATDRRLADLVEDLGDSDQFGRALTLSDVIRYAIAELHRQRFAAQKSRKKSPESP